MSKQLERLLNKALEKDGKQVINGRKVERDFGYTFTGDLEEKWSIKSENNLSELTLSHWGTDLITFRKYMGSWFYVEDTFYCESKSDRDGIKFLIDSLTTNKYNVSYRPSLEKGFLYNSDNEILCEV